MGSRLSSNGTSTPKPIKKPQAPTPAPADNNNTAAWKKPKYVNMEILYSFIIFDYGLNKLNWSLLSGSHL